MCIHKKRLKRKGYTTVESSKSLRWKKNEKIK